MQPSRLRFAATIVASGVLGGCGSFGTSLTNQRNAPDLSTERPVGDSSPITPLLEMMNALPQGDPARQAELFQSAKDAATVSPTTSNRLRYALALATPGHSGSDPVAAQRQLSELLARPETLLPAERALALVELQDVDQRLVLQAENRRLRDDAAHDQRDKALQSVKTRLSAEQDENARLRKALDEAHAKLEAVTHIERSINDRGATASPSPSAPATQPAPPPTP
jgi:hypothetical protein